MKGLRLISLSAIILVASFSYAAISPGDKAIVKSDTYIARDEGSYDELMKIADAGDEYGLRELMMTGRVFFVKAGTKVLIIESDTWKGKARVRVLEGAMMGMSGWILTGMLR